MQFTVDNVEPGGVVKSSDVNTPWALNVATAAPFERVEILVNGEVAWSAEGLREAGTKTYRGSVKTPSGGWIAARVHGGTTTWPAMDSYPFAHTAPVWFGAVGSTDPAAAGRAAVDLLAALDVAEARVQQAYKEAPATTILVRIAEARKKLQVMPR
jgi:TolB protein